ncbi:metal-sensing transcriptional repressor [uncultured Megasphaera sp.]|uniref:metal-sensing transcriptional repressor n=1 Tax=uncultured Megasphaera sp. TaxID=165188 RepID=UPI002591314D|nr:metal-sensing transcriptional repressor [uncultured Megasphaera sp.]
MTNSNLRLTEKEQKIISRLNRIEGQVRGVKNMIENKRSCHDTLTQIKAIQAALHSCTTELLFYHTSTLLPDIQTGSIEALERLLILIQKNIK